MDNINSTKEKITSRHSSLKYGGPEIANFMTTICQKITKQKEPKDFTQSLIKPIQKKEDPKVYKNNRTINLSKVMLRVFFNSR